MKTLSFYLPTLCSVLALTAPAFAEPPAHAAAPARTHSHAAQGHAHHAAPVPRVNADSARRQTAKPSSDKRATDARQARAAQTEQPKTGWQRAHARRVARLNHIQKLARAKGDTKTAARAERLLAKEKAHYAKKLRKHAGGKSKPS